MRAKGFEPPWLAPLEPKSSVSTSSTTPAGHDGGGAAGAKFYNTVARAEIGQKPIVFQPFMRERSL